MATSAPTPQVEYRGFKPPEAWQVPRQRCPNSKEFAELAKARKPAVFTRCEERWGSALKVQSWQDASFASRLKDAWVQALCVRPGDPPNFDRLVALPFAALVRRAFGEFSGEFSGRGSVCNRSGERLYVNPSGHADCPYCSVPSWQLRHDIPQPAFLSKRLEAVNVWIGEAAPGGSPQKSQLHVDEFFDNLYLMVRGRKRFHLFSPDNSARMYPVVPVLYVAPDGQHKFMDDSSGTGRHHFSQVNTSSPDLDHFPDWGPVPTELELEPGELLYLPAGWWHEVTSLAKGDRHGHVAVNWWWRAGEDARVEVLRHRLRHPEVIRLAVREVAMPPPDHSDGKQTYFSIACSGDTGAGKEFSAEGNGTCFVHKFILVFDMEGPKGTLPLMEVIPPEHIGPFKLDVSDPDHQRREKLRQEAVAKYFPPLAVAISNTMMYVTKTNPVKNHETALHIKQLAENCLKVSTTDSAEQKG
ncbi:unnamed protein product [Effrenium voratum]|nr:unnamed protein product [Effrenium voratum]